MGTRARFSHPPLKPRNGVKQGRRERFSRLSQRVRSSPDAVVFSEPSTRCLAPSSQVLACGQRSVKSGCTVAFSDLQRGCISVYTNTSRTHATSPICARQAECAKIRSRECVYVLLGYQSVGVARAGQRLKTYRLWPRVCAHARPVCSRVYDTRATARLSLYSI